MSMTDKTDRSTKGRGELLFSTEGHGELLFVHEGPRRAVKSTFCPRRDAEGRGEHQGRDWIFCAQPFAISRTLPPWVGFQTNVNEPVERK